MITVPDVEYLLDLNEVGRYGLARDETLIRSDFTTTYGPDVYVSWADPDVGTIVRCRDEDGATWRAEVIREMHERSYVVRLDSESYRFVAVQ